MKTLRIDIMDETPDEINEICKFTDSYGSTEMLIIHFNVIVCLQTKGEGSNKGSLLSWRGLIKSYLTFNITKRLNNYNIFNNRT